MRFDISGHQVEVTSALRQYVESKLERPARHFDHLLTVHVILSVEKLDHKAEATINVSGRSFHAESVAESMYAAIDLLADKLDRQILKHKEKITDHHRGEALSHSDDIG
ncbi:MAG: Ribosome hibernation promoting factor [Alphaproteobacteria bacterium ADurb.BinA280]|jgi:putative sigma-54 modulation protein|nr:ribosome-associated translation inhibitor RaiA [Xanthomonadales bacterium]MCC6504801.1 ribosome-associated translation inhibitor RaiA [Aquimonas sp.]OPZ10085.1 MAG: Ribosome hibernation promoting factor [Alphaproteobacteria bacterium ADurb.BinA280]